MLPVTALAAGILGAHFFYFDWSDLAGAAALSAVTLVCAFAVPGARRGRLAALSAAFVLGGIAVQIAHRSERVPRLNVDDAETVLLDGCVTKPPVFSPDRAQFNLQLAPAAEARISVVLKPGEKLQMAYGERIEVPAKIRSPRNFQNPGAFDYVGYLAAQHIYWTGSVSDLSGVHSLPGHCGNAAIGWMYGARTWALDRLTGLYPGDPHTAGMLQATLLGETSGVERRWTEDFRVTGTYHALVISGLHISIVATTLLLLLRLLFVRRVLAWSIAAAVCWLYAFLAGCNSPAIRAAAGFTLFVIVSSFFRKPRTLNLLAFIALVYLVFDPNQLFDPAFQLSFLSVAIIAAFAVPAMERFTQPLRASVKNFHQESYDPQVEGRAAVWRVELRLLAETIRVWMRFSRDQARTLVSIAVLLAVFMADAVIVSACVQFGLALPMISYFHRLSLTGLSANVLIVPLLTAIVPLGFAAILTGWHGMAAFTKLLLDWAEWLAGWHVHFEPPWRIAGMPLWAAVGFAAALIVLAWAIRRKKGYLTIAALSCSLTLFAAIWLQPWKPDLAPHALELTAIDVNQGDSLLLVFPDGKTMLVDAGGFPGAERMKHKPRMDMGEDVVSPYLWTRRISHLDYAVLTHGHSDHMGGLAAILDNFRPRELWIGIEPETNEWKTVEQHAAADNVHIRALNRSAQPISIGGAWIQVLAPSPEYVAGESPHNNDSLVLEVTYRKRSILLTGDAERPVEDDMIASGGLRPVTLLKVGHHGSKTSSSEEFLDQLHPQFALISDGYKNQFHHPHPDVLRRLVEHHARVFRTDLEGLITFRTDGDKVTVEPFR